MAYHMTREEVLAQVLRENDEEYSSFEDSESDKGEEDDNNVYGALEEFLVNYRQK